MSEPHSPGRLELWMRKAALRRRGVTIRSGTAFAQVSFRGSALIESGCRLLGEPEIELGERFFMNAYCDLRGDLRFGNDVLLGPKVVVWDRRDPAALVEGAAERAPVRVGDDVWIAASCVVLGGVTIGDGAVVGAGSIVLEDVPPGAIVVGNPARVVRERLASDRIGPDAGREAI